MMRTLLPRRRFAALALALAVLAVAATSVVAARGTPNRAAPKVTLKKPANGSSTYDRTPRLAGKAGHAAGDGRMVSVRVYSGTKASGKPLRLVTTRRSRGTWAVNLSPALRLGTYTARARQYDARGNRGASTPSSFTIKARSATIDPTVPPTHPASPPKSPKPPPVTDPPPVATEPVVAITSPAQGSATRDSTPAFVATEGDGAPEPATVTLTLFAGPAATGTPVRTLDLVHSGATWSGAPAQALPDGTYTALAQGVTAGGKTGRSAPVTFTVDTVAPQVALAVPPGGSSGTDTTPTFAGSAGAAAGDSGQVRVRVYAGTTDAGAPLATLTANRSGGSFSINAQSPLPTGTYSARADQADAAGNVGQSSLRTFAITSNAPAANYRDAVMADAPRAYWRLGEASGATAADQVPTASTGTYLGNPTLGQAGIVPTAQSTAVSLDGADDAVRIADSHTLDPGDALAIEAWIRPTALPTGNGTATLARKDLQYLLRLGAGGKVSFRLWRGGAATEVTSAGGAVSSGVWNHVVASFDGTSMTIYVNGSVRSTLAMGAPIDSSANPLYLGSSGGYDYLSGRLDEVALYGAALPAARIQAHLDQADPVNDSPPTLSLESPGNGSVTDGRPVFSGTAGVAKGDSATVTVKIFSGSSATGTAVQTLTTTRQSSTGTYSVTPSTALAPGTYTAQAEQTNTNGLVGRSSPTTFTVSDGSAPTIAAAGDIADCSGTDDEATADLLDDIPGTVMTLGDNAYTYGSASEFQCFDRSWGRHKARMRPIPGDHDYGQPNASGYFDYFGSAAGPRPAGYYSYNLGSWHVVALNSACYVQLRTCNDAEDEWLDNDLEQNSASCTLAQLHEPRFSSGEIHGNVGSVEPLWQILYDHGADIVLSGSEHMYERFAPQTPDGEADSARGIRQFTVGTGGESHYQVGDIKPNSQVRESNTFGVLKMTLRPGGYDWQFVPVAGKSFTDSGSGSCH